MVREEDPLSAPSFKPQFDQKMLQLGQGWTGQPSHRGGVAFHKGQKHYPGFQEIKINF